MPIHPETLTVTADHLARARRYPLTIELENGDWVARTPDPAFLFIVGAGETPEGAAAALVQNLAGQLALAELEHREVPEPLSGYGHPFSVRLPRSLHRALNARAAAEGVSVSQAVVFLLADSLAVPVPPRRGRQPAGRSA